MRFRKSHFIFSFISFGSVGCSIEQGESPGSGGTGGGVAAAGDGDVGSGGFVGDGDLGTGGSSSGGGPPVLASGGSATGGMGTGGTPDPSGPPPPVSEVEETGRDCPEPPLPGFDALTEVSHLPDPFEWSDGSGRISSVADYRCRRYEMRRELEEYGSGEKPPQPSTFEASLDGDTLRVTVGEGGNSFEITASISRPAGADAGPIPAIIGIGAPTGSLPGDVFSSRGIATISYDPFQVAPHNESHQSGEFYGLYPGSTAGYMVRWAWGVSRIIDALQALPEANIDTTHLAVSGCSYAGKVALYSGAFDERIALTIPHESGGGGTISWRYSDMLEDRDNTEVENLHHALGAPWYHPDLGEFAATPNKLPYDQHELMGMVAPRALLAIESRQIARMGAEAARIDHLAAREIWTALGVPHRMGAVEENVSHCFEFAPRFKEALEAYVDRFLLDDDTKDTDILESSFDVDAATWIPWETPAFQ